MHLLLLKYSCIFSMLKLLFYINNFFFQNVPYNILILEKSYGRQIEVNRDLLILAINGIFCIHFALCNLNAHFFNSICSNIAAYLLRRFLSFCPCYALNLPSVVSCICMQFENTLREKCLIRNFITPKRDYLPLAVAISPSA